MLFQKLYFLYSSLNLNSKAKTMKWLKNLVDPNCYPPVSGRRPRVPHNAFQYFNIFNNFPFYAIFFFFFLLSEPRLLENWVAAILDIWAWPSLNNGCPRIVFKTMWPFFFLATPPWINSRGHLRYEGAAIFKHGCPSILVCWCLISIRQVSFCRLNIRNVWVGVFTKN